MLVLSRQRDETIMIGDDIEVTVVDIRGDKVRLGITAPREISVHRKEVYDAIRRENREAAQVKPEAEVADPADYFFSSLCSLLLFCGPIFPSPERSSGLTCAAARFSRRMAS